MSQNSIELLQGSARQICPICQSLLLGQGQIVTCDRCGVRYHQQCWQTNQGCATYGCERAPDAKKLAVMHEGELTNAGGWGDNKACPRCNEMLPSNALKCPKCKATFDTRAPMTPEEYAQQEMRRAHARRMTWLSVALFSISALGIAAPITLTLAIVWLFLRRFELKQAASASVLLHYGSVALSTAWLAIWFAVFFLRW